MNERGGIKCRVLNCLTCLDYFQGLTSNNWFQIRLTKSSTGHEKPPKSLEYISATSFGAQAGIFLPFLDASWQLPGASGWSFREVPPSCPARPPSPSRASPHGLGLSPGQLLAAPSGPAPAPLGCAPPETGFAPNVKYFNATFGG